MGHAHSIICFSTSRQVLYENEILVGRSDHTTSLAGVKKEQSFYPYRATSELIAIHTVDLKLMLRIELYSL